jgi:hypothetical protein
MVKIESDVRYLLGKTLIRVLSTFVIPDSKAMASQLIFKFPLRTSVESPKKLWPTQLKPGSAECGNQGHARWYNFAPEEARPKSNKQGRNESRGGSGGKQNERFRLVPIRFPLDATQRPLAELGGCFDTPRLLALPFSLNQRCL